MNALATGGLPNAVLVHGVGLDGRMWDGLSRCLSGRLRCTAFDMPCHGEAGMPEGEVTLQTFSEALADIVDGLDGAPVVVGFSMGAMVAQRFALDRPDALKGLVLMNAVFDRDEGQRAAIAQRLAAVERDGPASMAESAIERWFTEEFRKARRSSSSRSGVACSPTTRRPISPPTGCSRRRTPSLPARPPASPVPPSR